MSQATKRGVLALTPRERDIARGIAEGLPNRAIAGRLGLSDKTVRNQLSVLYDKLGLAGRVQLALLVARQPELVEEPGPRRKSG